MQLTQGELGIIAGAVGVMICLAISVVIAACCCRILPSRKRQKQKAVVSREQSIVDGVQPRFDPRRLSTRSYHGGHYQPIPQRNTFITASTRSSIASAANRRRILDEEAQSYSRNSHYQMTTPLMVPGLESAMSQSQRSSGVPVMVESFLQSMPPHLTQPQNFHQNLPTSSSFRGPAPSAVPPPKPPILAPEEMRLLPPVPNEQNSKYLNPMRGQKPTASVAPVAAQVHAHQQQVPEKPEPPKQLSLAAANGESSHSPKTQSQQQDQGGKFSFSLFYYATCNLRQHHSNDIVVK